MVRCGEHWDALRMPRPFGELVLAALGEHSGPVIPTIPTAVTKTRPTVTQRPHCPPTRRAVGAFVASGVRWGPAVGGYACS